MRELIVLDFPITRAERQVHFSFVVQNHTGDVVCSAATLREAVERASEVYKSCSIDYSDEALAVMQKMAGDA